MAIPPDIAKKGEGPARAARPSAIVDAHHHLWQLGRFPYQWLSKDAPARPFGDHTPIKRDYLASDYEDDLDGLPVQASVHVQANSGADDPSAETAWLAGLYEEHGCPDAVVGYADLAAPDVEDVLAAHTRHDVFRGVRALVAWEPGGTWRFADRPGILREPAFRRGSSALRAQDLSLDLVVLPQQLLEVAELAGEMPDLSIVVDHLAMPRPDRPGDTDTWIEGIEAIVPLPNVAIKLSGLWTIDRDWRRDRLAPFVAAVLAGFGCDRVMYGSNLPIETLMCPARRQVDILSDLIAAVDPTALDAVFAVTARRVYRLGDQARPRR